MGKIWLIGLVLIKTLLVNSSVVWAQITNCPGDAKIDSSGKIYPFIKREFYGARLELNDKIIPGAGQARFSAFNDYSQAIGEENQPVIFIDYLHIKSLDSAKITDKFAYLKNSDHFIIPQIGLSFTQDGKPDSVYEKKVNAGIYDTKIKMLGRLLSRYNNPFFIRIGFEFNGHWNGYSSAEYVKAYNRIAEILRPELGNNVAFVWCYAPDGTDIDFGPYYPGDKNVDWMGIDLFAYWHFTQPRTNCFMAFAKEHRKPVIIGESTPRRINLANGEAAWNKWFVPYINFINTNPGLKATGYIYWNWKETPWPDWGNARFGEYPFIQKKLQEEFSKDHYARPKFTEKQLSKIK